MVIIKIEDNKEIRKLDIKMTTKNITELEKLFADSISRHIDKLFNK